MRVGSLLQVRFRDSWTLLRHARGRLSEAWDQVCVTCTARCICEKLPQERPKPRISKQKVRASASKHACVVLFLALDASVPHPSRPRARCPYGCRGSTEGFIAGYVMP